MAKLLSDWVAHSPLPDSSDFSDDPCDVPLDGLGADPAGVGTRVGVVERGTAELVGAVEPDTPLFGATADGATVALR